MFCEAYPKQTLYSPAATNTSSYSEMSENLDSEQWNKKALRMNVTVKIIKIMIQKNYFSISMS